MAITLTSSYKETLSPEIVETIDNMVKDGHDLDDLLTIVDYFSDYEDYLELIVDTLEDTGASNSELFDFLEEFEVSDLEYFEKYKSLREDYDPAAVDAYIELQGCVGCVDDFEDYYEGQFDSITDFVENIMETMETELPSWICIDYEMTWESSLSHDYCEQDGYYFRR